MHPSLSVDTGPKVTVKAVEAKLSKRVLKRYVPVCEENTVDNDLLVEGKRNLHDYLQSQGYYDVDVDFRVLPAQNDLETIEYVISRGPRYKLVHVVISGNKYFDEETIREGTGATAKRFAGRMKRKLPKQRGETFRTRLSGSPAWIRTTIHGSKGRCPTIRRPGNKRQETALQCSV